MKVPILSVEGGGAKGKTRYSLLLPLTMETLCAFNYSVTVGKGIHFRRRGFMCYSILFTLFISHAIGTEASYTLTDLETSMAPTVLHAH